jgi:hypothetical protein
LVGGAPPTRLGSDSVELNAPAAGDVRLRVRFTPYWAVVRGSGCVRRTPGGWTAISVTKPGRVTLATRFAIGRIVSRGPRCSG